MKRLISCCLAVLVLFVGAWLTPTAARALELPAIFSDHMVLQRDMPVPVWGKAEPGTQVMVVFRGHQAHTQADADGDWDIDLPAMAASAEPQYLHVIEQIENGVETQIFADVLVGDVWHCGGQSNMGWTVNRSADAEAEIAAADHSLIRVWTSPRTPADTPQFSSGGVWQVASPDTIGGFSAVAYYFGRKVHASQGVPIGLFVTSWGGASAEAYTPMEQLNADPATQPEVARYEAELERYRRNSESGVDPATLPQFHADPGPLESSAAFTQPGFDDAGWAPVNLPTTFENTPLGKIDGGVWFRKTLSLPEAWVGQALTLNLGTVDDFDQTFVNGRPVGAIGKETPNFYAVPRTYDVPAALTAGGELTVAVRVFDHYGEGGFTGGASAMTLHPAGHPDAAISVAGAWRAMADQPMSPDDLRGAHQVRQPQQTPAALWNGMIHPVAPFAHRGVLWYQGESNAGRAAGYRTLLPMMIASWRELWDQPGEHHDTPFLIVQLAHFQQPHVQPPASDNWGELRDAQAHVAATVPNTYLATAIDIGEADDIHPRNKQDVGLRLARLAEHHVYGNRFIVPVGPTMKQVSMSVDPSPIAAVLWDHAEQLTTTDGQPPRGFAMRPVEGDPPWVWAEAAFTNHPAIVKLTHPEGLHGPFEVRYAYGINPTDGPQGINLVNGEGLPAMPFRTDPVPGAE